MIRTLLTVVIFTFISGCTVHQSIGDNYGSFISKPKGQEFHPVGPRWDHENTALLYIYRPNSEWADDELETPSFNVNSKRLFNLKSGSYTWYELKPGEYDIVMRRGLMGFEGVNSFEIKRIANLSLEALTGQVYFLRYSEIDAPQDSDKPLHDRLGDGPLQLVSTDFALSEIEKTRMLHHGRDILEPLSIEVDVIVEQQEKEKKSFASIFGFKKKKSKVEEPESTEQDPVKIQDEKEQSKEVSKEEWWPF